MPHNVRWSDLAADDLRRIVLHIRQDNPSAAARVAQRIYEEVQSLSTMPHRGRVGREPGTRELVIAPLDYIVTYEVIGDGVIVHRIHHGAQDRPQR